MAANRGLLFIILGLLTFLLFQSWSKENNPEVVQKEITTVNVDSTKGLNNLIDLSNDLLDLKVNPYGGDLVGATLKKYQVSVDNPAPVELLSISPLDYFTITTGLTGANGIDTATQRPDYTVVSNEKTATGSELVLSYKTDNIAVLKKYHLSKDSYKLDLEYQVTNLTNSNISLGSFGTLKRIPTADSNKGFIASGGFSGAVISTAEDNYEKLDFSDIKDKKFKSVATSTGWIAIVNHFFLGAIVPDSGKDQVLQISTDYSNKYNYVNIKGESQVVAPQQTISLKDALWVGPKLQDQLAEVAPNLDLTVDYGWAWFLSKPLFKLLTFLHNLINDWGITIITLTIIVRLVLYPLSRIQFRTQAKMRIVAPEVKLINDRYATDRMKKAQEMQKLYKKHSINVLSGCFPVIIQMPIFLALFYVFNEAIELRHTNWLWIKDLSSRDPWFIIPVLNGITMIYMMRLTPMPDSMDPLQKKIMTYMPYFFVVFFLFLPAGLVLYYTISNILTILMIKYNFWRVNQEYAHKRIGK